ncbi:MAG: sigma-70 family RNA polymerase sigma factor [Bacteroidales bacterium]|jgi:RNA polymerase sigma-70 factor (ECF subfamily)|nr:sigma-70 family RNA polymerase sigma factor [Bacteroidales bacterium]
MGLTTNLTERGIRDYELVKRALDSGDQKAYADLMDNYREPLYYMILKMTNSNADADDLTLEAFGKAFRNLAQYTPTYAFSTWLFTIATNNCIDYIRKRKVEMVSIDKYYTNSVRDSQLSIAGSEPDPEEIIIEKQTIKTMQEVIKKLKPTYRKVIDLRYFQELSYEEIARVMSMPMNTVKIKLYRAKLFLHNIIKESNTDLLS